MRFILGLSDYVEAIPSYICVKASLKDALDLPKST
jgi:hypothetical protein